MTETENIEKEIISIVSDVTGFDKEEITPDTHFFNDLEIDSVKAIEITVAVEKKFKVKVRDEDVPNITTIRHAVELTNKLITEQSSP